MKCFSKIFVKSLKLTQQHKDMKKIIKLTESDLQEIVNKVVFESQEDEKFEKGKSGVRASRSKADFQPTPKESEIMKVLFGKYENVGVANHFETEGVLFYCDRDSISPKINFVIGY